MRAKYAKQLRRGIVRAKYDVWFALEHGYPDMHYSPDSELEARAYDRTLHKLLAGQVLASVERVEAKMLRWKKTL